MAKNKKSPILHNGIEFDSKEEVDFYCWLKEAEQYGIIKGFKYNHTHYVLSNKETTTVYKKLKTKTKTVEKHLFHEHVYTPDFWIFPAPKLDLFDHGLITTHNPDEIIVDVKGTFQLNDGSRSFSINQKWMYSKYGIYVNKLIPEKFFQKTFCPLYCKHTPKTKKIRAKMKNVPTLEEKIILLKSNEK